MIFVLPLPSMESLEDKGFEAFLPYYQELEAFPLEPGNAQSFLRRWSELLRVMLEHAAKIGVAVSVDTESVPKRETFERWVSEAEPAISRHEQLLKEKLVASKITPEGLGPWLRGLRSDIEDYREANVEIEAKLSLLANEHGRLEGGQMVEYKGKELTLQQLGPLLEDPDRAVRQEAFELRAARLGRDEDAVLGIFHKMLPLRLKMAGNAGYEAFIPYWQRKMCRFDYTPEDCGRLHEALLASFAPLALKLEQFRLRKLGLSRLRPWDMGVDPFEGAQLKPFSGVKDLVSGVERIAQKISPPLAGLLRRMDREGCLDLDSRKGKRAGGYCANFPRKRLSFIFMNAAGTQDDVETLVHELGHAWHSELGDRPGDLIFGMWGCTSEFAEVASMSMELLAMPHLEEFYAPRDAARARLSMLMALPSRTLRIATLDAFQREFYAAPNGADEDAIYARLYARLRSSVDWSGFERFRDRGWRHVLHIIRYPFYMIDYAFAQLGALSVFSQARRDPAAAFERYCAGLALGGSKTLPELFRAVGASFPPAAGEVAEYAAALEAQINSDLKLLGEQELG